ncbi:MAG: MFS transporter [Deltaproteobacteria bacterium]|nr:MFS transporter [Deltaproteobacteria bacterium]
MASVNNSIKVLGISLSPGVSRFNFFGWFYVAMFSTLMLAFLNAFQPFILTNFIGVPKEDLGKYTGMILVFSEIVIITFTLIYGTLSDRIGRSRIYALGFFLSGTGLFLISYSSSVPVYIVTRMLWATGAAAVGSMLATVLADYPREESRGKMTGITGVMNGIGSITSVAVLVRLPNRLVDAGMTTDIVQAGQYTLYGIFGLSFITSIFSLWAVRSNTPAGNAPVSGLPFQEKVSRFFRDFLIGAKAAKDPGVALSYGIAFVARGDLVVGVTFVSLWVRKSAMLLSLETGQALAIMGAAMGIMQGTAFVSGPLYGILADKLQRTTAVCIGLTMATIGFGSTFLIADLDIIANGAIAPRMIPVLILVGLGEMGALITGQVLIAQQAPRSIRGSVMGFFTVSGAVGIVIATMVGGLLFDFWRSAGPFLFFSVVNGLLLVCALAVKNKVRPPAENMEEEGS